MNLRDASPTYKKLSWKKTTNKRANIYMSNLDQWEFGKASLSNQIICNHFVFCCSGSTWADIHLGGETAETERKVTVGCLETRGGESHWKNLVLLETEDHLQEDFFGEYS